MPINRCTGSSLANCLLHSSGDSTECRSDAELATALAGAGFGPPTTLPLVGLDSLGPIRFGYILVTKPGLPHDQAEQARYLNVTDLLVSSLRALGPLLVDSVRYKLKFLTILPEAPLCAVHAEVSAVLERFGRSFPYGLVFRLSIGGAPFEASEFSFKRAVLMADAAADSIHPCGGIKLQTAQDVT